MSIVGSFVDEPTWRTQQFCSYKFDDLFDCSIQAVALDRSRSKISGANKIVDQRVELRHAVTDREQRSQVRGIGLDAQTRCIHYHSARDIVAIKTKCCGLFYACKDCHNALAEHALLVWPASEWEQNAVLCGNCQTELSIRQYLDCESKCPTCKADFNPGCRHHLHYYFEMRT